MKNWACLSILLILLSCNASTTKSVIDQPTSLIDSVIQTRKEQQEERLSGKVIHSSSDLSYFNIDEAYKVEARFTPGQDEASFNIPTYSGMQKEFYKYGSIQFTLNGKERTLFIYRNLTTIKNKKYKDYLFLPFMDHTSGDITYGGGRYIDLKTTDIVDNKLELDFNKAYNPYCAYGDGWNCPIPPVENHLDTPIKAGEMAYKGPKKDRS